MARKTTKTFSMTIRDRGTQILLGSGVVKATDINKAIEKAKNNWAPSQQWNSLTITGSENN